MKNSSRWAAVIPAVALLALGLAGPVSAAESAPGGMHRFVVTIGKVDPSVSTNWNRLGMYSFSSTTNEVTESHWHWTQRERVARSYTGVRAANCGARNCNVQTGNGFQSASAPERLHGTYTVSGSVLRITWDSKVWEEWGVTMVAGGKLAKLTLIANSFGATHGFGYGSDAAWTTRASMSQIASADWTSLIHTYYVWKTDANRVPYVDHGTGGAFWYRHYTVCTGSTCAAGRTEKAQYYLSLPNPTAKDRRTTLWHWFTANADNRGEYCYTGNSHVKPLLQIIDSDGVFHGWVGVETSINQAVPSQGAAADDIGILVIADV